MTRAAKKIFDEVMGLAKEDRVDLVAALLERIDAAGDEDPDAVARAWSEEVVRRKAELTAGTAKLVPWDEARKRIFDRG